MSVRSRADIRLSTARAAWFFGRAEPGEPGVQQGDGLGSGGQWYLTRGEGWGRRVGRQGAAGAQVAAVGPTAARADAAQLQRGLVKEYVGVVGHSCHPDTTFALLGETSKRKVLYKQILAREERGCGAPRTILGCASVAARAMTLHPALKRRTF
jgi:hypothetical protein